MTCVFIITVCCYYCYWVAHRADYQHKSEGGTGGGAWVVGEL